MADEKTKDAATADVDRTTTLHDGRVFFPGTAHVDAATAKQIEAANKAADKADADADRADAAARKAK